jgi:hypothetical protein
MGISAALATTPADADKMEFALVVEGSIEAAGYVIGQFVRLAEG